MAHNITSSAIATNVIKCMYLPITAIRKCKVSQLHEKMKDTFVVYSIILGGILKRILDEEVRAHYNYSLLAVLETTFGSSISRICVSQF